MNRNVAWLQGLLLSLLFNAVAFAEEQGRTVELSLPLSGVVQQVLVQQGDAVQQGQALLKIDARRYQLRLNRAEAALQAARVEAEDVAVELNNQLDLYERMVTTESDLKQAKRDAARADAVIAQRTAERDEAALDLEWTVLKAPLDGVIRQRLAEPGEVVSRHHPTSLLLLQVAE